MNWKRLLASPALFLTGGPERSRRDCTARRALRQNSNSEILSCMEILERRRATEAVFSRFDPAPRRNADVVCQCVNGAAWLSP